MNATVGMSALQQSTSGAAGESACDDFPAWSTQQLGVVEQALAGWVGAQAPENLSRAMRYAVLGGGKRLRPLLVLAASKASDSPNFTCTVGLPRRSTSLSMQGMSSCTRE